MFRSSSKISPSAISSSSARADPAAFASPPAPVSSRIMQACRSLTASRIERAPFSSRSLTAWAAARRSLVTPEQAETTTSGARPSSPRMIRITLRMAVASSTEVPPNFMTIMGSGPLVYSGRGGARRSLENLNHQEEGVRKRPDHLAEEERERMPPHQDQDEEDPEETDAPVTHAHLLGEQRRHHMRPVERRYGDHVENAQDDVQDDPAVEHLQEKDRRIGGDRAGFGHELRKFLKHDVDDRANEGEDKIRNGTHDGDEYVVAPHVRKIERVDGNRLRPSDENAPGRDQRKKRNEHRSYRVDVRNGIQRQAPEIARRRVAEPEGHPSVGDFMDHDGKEKNREDIELLRHRGSPPGKRPAGAVMKPLRVWRTVVRRPLAGKTGSGRSCSSAPHTFRSGGRRNRTRAARSGRSAPATRRRYRHPPRCCNNRSLPSPFRGGWGCRPSPPASIFLLPKKRSGASSCRAARRNSLS